MLVDHDNAAPAASADAGGDDAVRADAAVQPGAKAGFFASRYGRNRKVRYRRTWPQRLIIASSMALVAGCLYSAWYIGDVRQTFGDIPRIGVSPEVLATVEDIRFDARNILLLGSTDLTNFEGDDAILFGRGAEKLTDTIMILRIDPLAATAAVISLPRDLAFTNTKVNAYTSFNGGSPETLIKAIKQYMNIDIHDFALVNFGGFRRIIDSIGGVPVYFPTAVRDQHSYFEAPAGCSILSGEQSLNYVRGRYFEVQGTDGKWRFDNKSDYGRAERQRDFLILALDQAVAKGGRNPSTMRNLLKTAIESKSVVLDEKMTPDDLLNIAKAFSNFQPEFLQRYALPTVSAGVDSNLRLDSTRAEPILDVFRGNTPDIQPFQINLTLLDARNETDAAGLQKAYAQFNFRSAPAKKAPGGPQGETVIRFTSDERYAAQRIARMIEPLPYFEQIPGSKATLRTGETLTLVVGNDYRGLRELRGDEELPLINRLLDASATGKVSAASLKGASSSPAPSTTTRSGAIGAPSSVPASTAPTSTAPAVSAAETDSAGIIGLPPEGAKCSRFDSPR